MLYEVITGNMQGVRDRPRPRTKNSSRPMAQVSGAMFAFYEKLLEQQKSYFAKYRNNFV